MTLTERFQEFCAGNWRFRSAMDSESLAPAGRRLHVVLKDYPADVAIAGMDAWQASEEYFPTEAELRHTCDRVRGDYERQRAAARGSNTEPQGATRIFVSRVREVMGEDYAKSWLAGGVSCMFTADTIYTTGFGVSTLLKQCSGIAEECQVKIVQSDRARQMLQDYCNARGLRSETGHKRKRFS